MATAAMFAACDSDSGSNASDNESSSSSSAEEIQSSTSREGLLSCKYAKDTTSTIKTSIFGSSFVQYDSLQVTFVRGDIEGEVTLDTLMKVAKDADSASTMLYNVTPSQLRGLEEQFCVAVADDEDEDDADEDSSNVQTFKNDIATCEATSTDSSFNAVLDAGDYFKVTNTGVTNEDGTITLTEIVTIGSKGDKTPFEADCKTVSESCTKDGDTYTFTDTMEKDELEGGSFASQAKYVCEESLESTDEMINGTEEDAED